MRSAHLHLIYHHLRQAWNRRLAFNLFIIFALFASFTILNSALLVAKNFEALSQFWGSKVEMNVYLKPDSENLDALKKSLEAEPMVKTVRYISKAQAYGELKLQLASHAPEILKDPELMDFIPESFLLEMKTSENPEGYFEKIGAFANQLRTVNQVEEVQYGMGWMTQLKTILGIFRQIGVLLFSVLLLGSLFMVAFVIRNSLIQRRDEIELLELVGASRFFVRAPFLFEGGLISLVAGVLSLWATNTLFAKVKSTLMAEDLFIYVAYRLNQFSFAGLILFSIFYALLGIVVSYFCLRSLNTGFAAADGQRKAA